MDLGSEHALANDLPNQTGPARETTHSSTTLLLVLVTLAGAWLRLSNLGSKSLWLDEGATVALARMPWRHFAWVWWRQEANMTAYYLLLRPWLRMGIGESWVRLPSVLFGVASIPVLYVLSRRLLNSRGALVAAALLTVNPAHIYYSQEARSYSLTIFLVLLSSLFFVRAFQDGGSSDWAWWVVFSVLSVYGHYFAALVLVSQAASVLMLRPEQVPWKRFILCSALIAILAIPGIAFVWLRGPTLILPWIPKPSVKELIHLWMFLGGSGVKFAVSVVLWGAGTIAIAHTWKRWGRSLESWRDSLVLLWALLPIAITIVASLHRSVFNQRYLLICLPATVMLAALGAESSSAKRIGLLLVAALCVMSVITVVKNNRKPREDWRGASSAILASAQPKDAVVFFPFYARIMLDYYRQLAPQPRPALHVFAPQFYDGGEDERDLLRALNSDPQQFRHVWVVLYGSGAHVDDLEQRNPALAAKLHSAFDPPQVRRFADIAVLEFGKW